MLAGRDNQDCLDSLDVKTGEIVSTVPLCYAPYVETGEIVSIVPPCYASCVEIGEIVSMLHAYCVKTGEAVSMLPASCVETGEIVSMLHACCVEPPVCLNSHVTLVGWSLDFHGVLLPGPWPDCL